MPVIEETPTSLDAVAPLRRASDRPATMTPAVAAPASDGVNQLERTLLNIPSADRARVATLKAAILSGRYSVDADAVAASLVAFERQLGE